MPIITWDDSIAVHIREIDDQHKKLVELLNELHDAMRVGKGNIVLGSLLEGLIDYTVTHFATEERLMTTYQYPEMARHKKEHEKLTAQVLELQKKFSQGAITLTLDVSKFLKDWLVNHIQDTDKLLGTYLQSKGIK